MTLLFSTQIFAQDICAFEETWEFEEALSNANIKTSKISKNHKRFLFVEKQMIHLAITQEDWLKGCTRDQALEVFSDYNGSNAGEISYYQIQGKTYALVHYWPGENEMGAYFEMTSSAFKLIATISDSFIRCK